MEWIDSPTRKIDCDLSLDSSPSRGIQLFEYFLTPHGRSAELRVKAATKTQRSRSRSSDGRS